jgi:hypothetical protein
MAIANDTTQGAHGHMLAGPSRRRRGKELLEELGIAREKVGIIVDMAKARGAM